MSSNDRLTDVTGICSTAELVDAILLAMPQALCVLEVSSEYV